MGRLSLVVDLAGPAGASVADVEVLCRSLLAQSSPTWEALLCTSAEHADRDELAGTVDRLADRRVRLLVAPAGRAGSRLRTGLAVASGDLVSVLDPDGWLHPDAVEQVSAVFADPEVDVVYTDEEWGPGDEATPVSKPGWSPHHLEAHMYLGRLAVVRTSVLRATGGVRDVAEVARDWDIALRSTAAARRVVHLRRVLFRSRRPPAGLSGADLPPTDVAALEGVLADHLARTGPSQRSERIGETGRFRVRRPFDSWPTVGVVITTAGTRAPGATRMRVLDCLDDLLARTDHGRLDVVVVVSGNARDGIEDEVRAVHGARVRCVRLRGGFNYSRSINAGVRAVRGELLLLLNDDIRVLHGDWLRRMVERALDPRVGVVGAKLLLSDGRVQHVGVVHNVWGNPYHPANGEDDGYGHLGDLVVDADHLAVTGACQVLRREVFDRVGGYDTELPLNYNDIDFCLKVVRAARLSVLQLNGVRLCHVESASRVAHVHPIESDRYQGRWPGLEDPFVRDRSLAPRPAAVPSV